MIDLKNLMDLLPSYYKEYDSYKDGSGKGLLEKFLDICGSYFQETLIDLDTYLENHRVSNIDELYVNNLWEFLGEFPFLQSDTFNPDTFAQIFNGSNLAEAKNKSRIYSNSLLNALWKNHSQYTVRNILPHVISLYKIRGTVQFFDIIFRLFNLSDKITMRDSYENLSEQAKKRVPQYLYDSSVSIFKHVPSFGSSTFDKSSYDTEIKCNTCVARFFEVDISDFINTGTLPLKTYIDAIKGLIDKFIPFYINPVIIFTGQGSDLIYDNFEISVDAPFNTLISGSMVEGNYEDLRGNDVHMAQVNPRPYIELSVDLRGSFEDYLPGGYLVGYRFSRSGNFLVNPNNIHEASIYRVYIPGQYVFIPLVFILSHPNYLQKSSDSDLLVYDHPTNIDPTEVGKMPKIVEVSEEIYTAQWSIYAQKDPSSSDQLDNLEDYLIYNLIGSLVYSKLTTLPDSSTTRELFTQYQSSGVICINAPNHNIPVGIDTVVSSIPVKQFQLTEKGIYTFALRNYPNLRSKVKVNSTPHYDSLLGSLIFEVGPATQFTIRNQDFEPGDKDYDVSSIGNKGVKGAYYLKDGVYKPWDRIIQITCKTQKGKPINVVLTKNSNKEIIEVNDNGIGQFTLPKSSGAYVLTPEGYSSNEVKPITLTINTWDDEPEVTVNIRNWYIQPFGSISVDEGGSISLNGYATISVVPSGQASIYHPYIALLKLDELPITEDVTLTLGDGLTTTPEGQQLLLSNKVIGRLFRMSHTTSDQYSAQMNLSQIKLSDSGKWVTTVFKSLSDLKTTYQALSGQNGNRNLILSVTAYIRKDFGFFGIDSNLSAWTDLETNEYTERTGQPVYVTGSVSWSYNQPTFTIIPCIAATKEENNSYTWISSIYTEMRDSLGNTYPFQTWDNSSTLETAISKATYEFPLEGYSKLLRFYGIKEDGTEEQLFGITMNFPNHEPTITSNIESQEFPEGTDQISLVIKATSNRLTPPWTIYVNGESRGNTTDSGDIQLTLAVPGQYHIYADMLNTGEAINDKNPSIDLDFTLKS